VSTDPCWDEDFGPTISLLLKLYRSRLLNPELKSEYRTKMTIISSFRKILVELEIVEAKINDEVMKTSVEIAISMEECFVCVQYVS
jgi:hypothetical protein